MIYNYSQFVLFFRIYLLLIEKKHNIKYENIFVIIYNSNNICLKKYKIYIRLYNLIKIIDINYYSGFIFVI